MVSPTSVKWQEAHVEAIPEPNSPTTVPHFTGAINPMPTTPLFPLADSGDSEDSSDSSDNNESDNEELPLVNWGTSVAQQTVHPKPVSTVSTADKDTDMTTSIMGSPLQQDLDDDIIWKEDVSNDDDEIIWL
jgi:hypothetical protein